MSRNDKPHLSDEMLRRVLRKQPQPPSPEGFRKTGTVYGQYKGLPLYHYRCDIHKEPPLDGVTEGCCHRGCRLRSLRDAGLTAVAEQLARNDAVRDWLANWGRVLYDPRAHGTKRNDPRRLQAAEIVRQLRRGGIDYAIAVRVGVFTGATA